MTSSQACGVTLHKLRDESDSPSPSVVMYNEVSRKKTSKPCLMQAKFDGHFLFGILLVFQSNIFIYLSAF